MAYIATGARTKQTLGVIPGLVDDDPDPLAALRAAASRSAAPSNSAAGLAALRAAAARGDSAGLAALRAANAQNSGIQQAPILGRQIGEGTGGMSMTTKLLIGAAVLGGAALLLARKK
jgi:hypothetical protein